MVEFLPADWIGHYREFEKLLNGWKNAVVGIVELSDEQSEEFSTIPTVHEELPTI